MGVNTTLVAVFQILESRMPPRNEGYGWRKRRSDSFDLHIFSKIVKTQKFTLIFELTIHFDKNPAHISIINVSIRITRY